MTQSEIKPPRIETGRPVVPLRPRGTQAAAAADAVGFLRRLGFAVMIAFVPIAAVVMRHALVGVAPVGATLFVLAALIESEGRDPFRRMWNLLWTPAAALIALLLLWSGLSLLWTPFFDDASDRWWKAASIAVVVLASIGAMPERMRASNLYLIPLGVGIGSVLAIGWILAGPSMGLAADAGPVLQRNVLSVTLLAWPALAWLLMRSQRAAAVTLAAVVAGGALLTGARPAVFAMFAGGAAFGLYTAAPRATNAVIRWVLPLLILTAPLLPLALLSLPQVPWSDSTEILGALTIWHDVVLSEPVRLLTGHGLDTILRSQLADILPSSAPHSILFEVWYELGLIGAASLSALIAVTVRVAAGYGPALAPCIIGATVNLFIFACLGLVSSQPWFLTLIGVTVIAFCAVIHGRFGTRRPKASLNR